LRCGLTLVLLLTAATGAAQGTISVPRELCLLPSAGVAMAMAKLRPIYPAAALAAGKAAQVGLRVRLADDGRAREVTVCLSSGDAEFDKAARQWAYLVRFTRSDSEGAGGRPYEVNVNFDPATWESVAAFSDATREGAAALAGCDNSKVISQSIVYPREILVLGVGGSVEVEAELSAKGDVVSAHVAVSSGQWQLDRAVIEAIWKLKCSPGSGPRRIRLPVSFKISPDDVRREKPVPVTELLN
jgi:TonB family protein